jgi:uncharacterized phiE125 gp8 family phage protein
MQSELIKSISIAEPSSEPLTLAEAKKHLEIAQAVDTHDDHLTRLIQAAREVWEHDTSTITVSRSVTESVRETGVELVLSMRPVQSITSVTFDGTVQDSGTYSFDPNRRIIYLDEGYAGEDWNSVQVVYVAGPTAVTEISKAAMCLQLDLMFQPANLIKHHQDAYDRLVRKFMRASYP